MSAEKLSNDENIKSCAQLSLCRSNINQHTKIMCIEELADSFKEQKPMIMRDISCADNSRNRAEYSLSSKLLESIDSN